MAAKMEAEGVSMEGFANAVKNAQEAVQVQLSCAVCWQDFNLLRDLDEHIRDTHPDRIIDEYELLVRPA